MIKKGDTVYFVNVPFGEKTPKMFERVVTRASEKQIELEGYGPNLTVRFWRAPDGSARHSDYFAGRIPAFCLTKEEAIQAYTEAQKMCLAEAEKQVAQCLSNLAIAATWDMV